MKTRCGGVGETTVRDRSGSKRFSLTSGVVFTLSKDRESEFQDRLVEIFKEAIKGVRFNGIGFDDVKRGVLVDGREADIVLFYGDMLPSLVKGDRPLPLFPGLYATKQAVVSNYVKCQFPPN